MNDTKFISRDLETQEIKDLGNAGYYHTYVDYYVESLVLNDKKAQLCSYWEKLKRNNNRQGNIPF